jgi:endonuclease/exonuclease/phosphatase family metal-dependent hydrolase
MEVLRRGLGRGRALCVFVAAIFVHGAVGCADLVESGDDEEEIDHAISSPYEAATTVTFSAPGTQITADLTIQGGTFATTDFSGSDVLASKLSASESYVRRILLKVDTSVLPTNAVIQSATLQLVLKVAESAEQRPFTAFYVNRSFITGETNWIYYRPGQAWSSPGGDYGASFGTTYVGGSVGSTVSFDLRAMVQRIVAGEFGSRYTRVALLDTGALTSGNYRAFHSTRAADPSLRPRLVVTYTTQAAPAPAPPPPTSTATSLRVMQWNIHKTKGSDDVCNPDRTVDTIVAQRPDVASLNEINFYSGTCAWNFDMSVRLHQLLEQKTGATWYRQAVNGMGGVSGVGNALFSKYPLTTRATRLLSYDRGVAQIGITVNGRVINLFSTHVDYANASWRTQQIQELLPWVAQFAEPRIVMGDFNTNPGTSDYNLLAGPYQDAWAAARSAGTATSYNGTGNTRGGSRFDYVFFTRNGPLTLTRVNVPDTRVNGVYPSDHDPVVADFEVR